MATRQGAKSARQPPTKHGRTTAPAPTRLAGVERERLYRAFFEEANDIFAVFDLHDTIVLLNREVERVLGYRYEELG